MTDKSDTPRTDAALLRYTGGELVTFPKGLRPTVDADFARNLEREVTRLAGEVAERDSKISGLVHALDDLHGTPCEQIRHRQEMEEKEAQVAAFKGDAERLQWLQEHYAYVMLNGSRMKQMIDPSGTGTLRAAIDAAIKETAHG